MPVRGGAHAQPRAPGEEGRLPVRARGAARALAALAAALVVASCATTPALDRHILRAEAGARSSATMKGSRGYLSREQSKAVLERLKAKSPDSGALERHVAIEEALSGDPLSIGNRVKLLEDGRQTYEAMLAAIRSARHHVHIETYIFEADETGQLFADALIAKAKAGVKVRVIYDAVGCIRTPKEFFKRMAEGGVELLEFNPIGKGGIDALNQRDHRKITVVDGRIAFLGGINISDVYGGSSGGGRMRDEPVEKRPWRDLQSSVEGPAVTEIQRAFLAQWARKRNEPPITDRAYYPTQPQVGPHVVRVLVGSPAEGVNDTYAAMISAIDSAEKEVRIINPYFVPHEELRRALREAAGRGVEVTLILPAHSDSWITYYAGRSYYGELLAAGVKIYERRNRILHAKSATVDGVWSTIGSTNLDWRSLVYNDEINIVVLGPEFAAGMNSVLERDLANSDAITRETWAKRPLDARAKEVAAKAWAHWL